MLLRCRSWGRRLLIVAAVLALALLSASDLEADSERSWAGLSLDSALQELRVRGLRIVFSDNLVRPEMTVENEPLGDEPRQILAEILAAHGLEARDGPNRTIVVVRLAPREVLEGAFAAGVVAARSDGRAIAGARVFDIESETSVLSDEEGRFSMQGVTEADPRTLEVTAGGFLPARLEDVTRGSTLTVMLDTVPTFEEAVVVSPSRLSLLRDEPVTTMGLSRDEITNLPQLGGDFYRALTLLPGMTSNDVSAQFHVRGGRRDETQILLDGQELYDAFHLKDRDSAVSFIVPETIGGADLNTGGFPAEYGDRMSGVLDMTTVRPSGAPRLRIGIGTLAANVGANGRFFENRGGWLIEARRGATDLVGRLLGDEDPLFWDVFGKGDLDLTPRQTLRLNVLASGDELDFEEILEDERKRFVTDYSSEYAWLTHQAIVSPAAVVETSASIARIERDRQGVELEEGARFEIADFRETSVSDFRQGWDLVTGEDASLAAGWQLRRFETEYDYSGFREFDNPLAVIRHDFGRSLSPLADEFEDEQASLYAAQRMRPLDRTTVELGARWDRHSLTDEDFVSPRLNIAQGVSKRGVLRLAWGRYNQSQRSYELGVEDSERAFQPVERSEHRVLGLETLIDREEPRRDLTFRVEVYQRKVRNPRPRYENIYEPLNTFPEVEPDRVRVVPERSRAQGVELFARGGAGSRLDWWINYAWSATEDLLDGRWTPRLFDQTHALNLDVDWRLAAQWRLNAAWRFHTGWPTTPLSLAPVVDDGERRWVPVLGPLNSDRVADYHRLDLRASRSWARGWGSLSLYLDVQNVYDRANVAGFDYEIDDEEASVMPVTEAWAGTLPSAGVRIEF